MYNNHGTNANNKTDNMKRIRFYGSIAITLILIILRITGVISWSWWLITAFVWVPFVLALIFVAASRVIAKRLGE